MTVWCIRNPLLIESNRQRAKTPEQIAREGRELKRIETALAKRRKQAAAEATHKKLGRKTNEEMLRKNLPQASDDGKARDIAAAKVGVSGKGTDGSGGRGKKKNPSPNVDDGLGGRADEIAAKKLGVSGKTLDKVRCSASAGCLKDNIPRVVLAYCRLRPIV